MAETRLYRIKFGGKDFLVDAPNAAQALRYVVGKHAIIAVCTAKEAVELVARGVAVERSGREANDAGRSTQANEAQAIAA